jgi:hypothetical protein
VETEVGAEEINKSEDLLRLQIVVLIILPYSSKPKLESKKIDMKNKTFYEPYLIEI